jgi:hypothetical protein
MVGALRATGSCSANCTPAGCDGLRAQVRAFRSWQVWLTLTATALSYGGMFGAFSYIAYTFTEVGGFSSADVAWLLMVYGVGLVVGNMIGGRAADRDRDRDRALVSALLGLAITLAVFGLLAGSATASVILVFLMGLFGFASVPGMITSVTDAAHGAALAASANVSASTSATPSAPGSGAWPSPRASATPRRSTSAPVSSWSPSSSWSLPRVRPSHPLSGLTTVCEERRRGRRVGTWPGTGRQTDASAPVRRTGALACFTSLMLFLRPTPAT